MPTSASTAPEPTFADAAVPVIDLTPYFSGDPAAKAALAEEVDRACRTIGFLVISGHGVPKELLDRTERATRAFFDLPMAVKQGYASNTAYRSRGYYGMETSALAATIGEESLPDFREMYAVGEHRIDTADPYFTSPEGLRSFEPNIYPAEIPGAAAAWDEYFDAMTELSTALMRIFALALELDEHFFDDKIDKHITNLTLSNYPDQPKPPGEGQLRAGPHTDYGSFTILKTENKPGGLEVRTPDGLWEPVPIVPDAFIINIGDLMARWTNDRWVSTMHRVVNPPRDQATGSRRQSLIFFHQPNYDAVVECLPSCIGDGARYPRTTSGDHLWEKLELMKV